MLYFHESDNLAISIYTDRMEDKVFVDFSDRQTIAVEKDGNSISLDNEQVNYHLIKTGDSSYKLVSDRFIKEVDLLNHKGKSISLLLDGHLIVAQISTPLDRVLTKLGMDQATSETVSEVKAPMPGSILEILVSQGDTVKQDDKLLVLEAMKMENVIKAPCDAVVSEVHIKITDNVEKNQVLISFE